MLLCPSWKFPNMNHSINQLIKAKKNMTDYNLEKKKTTTTDGKFGPNPTPSPPSSPQDQGWENGAILFSQGFNPSNIVNCDDHDDISVSVLWTQDNHTNKQTQGQTGEKLILKKQILLIITVKPVLSGHPDMIVFASTTWSIDLTTSKINTTCMAFSGL